MPRYYYNSLNETDGEIRLVTILPGTGDIKLSLKHTHLKQNHTPSYEALSYTWGSKENPIDIQVDSATLSVTRNLHNALQHLRGDVPCVMWIDSICVNQEDLPERGHQVRRMADVYAKAARVVVWLGPQGTHTNTGFDRLIHLANQIEADWSLWITQPAEGAEASWSDPKHPLPYDRNSIDGIRDICSREWFQRLWVQQEIRLANQEAVIVCGHQSMLFNLFRKAILCLFNNIHLDRSIDKIRLSHIWSMGDLGYTNLPGIISFTRPCLCGDPRDRIYAILSFLQQYEKDLIIIPDYNKSFHQIYEETTWRWIEHNSALDILTLCDGTSLSVGFPSWVPNLAQPPRSYLLQTISTASARTSCAATYSGGILKLTGVSIAKIRELVLWQDKESIIDTIHRFASLCSKLGPLEGEILDAFCSALNGNLFSRVYIPDDKNSPNFEKFRRIIQQILSTQFNANQLSESDRAELFNAEKYITGRTFFITDTGSLGLAPILAKAGDEILILLGGRSAFVLRSNSGRFHMIGEAYIHGYMYGEALLGPFPEQIRSIARYDEKTDAYWRCYLNLETNVCEAEDPRLGPLPSGWRRAVHDKDHVIAQYVNDDTGEGFDQELRDNGFIDPRLTPAAIKQRGVKLQTFEIA